MYYLANFSVVSIDQMSTISINSSELDDGDILSMNENESRKTIFSQVDLWNLQRHMRTIHVSNRIPRTWEGL